jgi:hypothetical protein
MIHQVAKFCHQRKTMLEIYYVENIPKIKTLANTKQKSCMGVYDY